LILILSSHLRLGPQSGVFPSSFPMRILYTPPLVLIHTICPAHLILLDLIAHVWWGVLIMKLLILQFSPFPCYLLPLRPKHVPQHPISNSLSLSSTHSVRDQVSCPLP
jgi:hypothetical protein